MAFPGFSRIVTFLILNSWRGLKLGLELSPVLGARDSRWINVKFDALPGIEMSAKIKEIGKEASQATRTYPVTLVMAQPADVEILPGMAGEASIVSRPPEKSKLVGIEIPATAVFSGDDPNKSYVWIVDEATKTLSRREVQIGQLARFGVLIKAGLEPGEWIVVKGVHSVDEGQQVRILDAAQAETAS